jgi:hypothetical protein
MERWIRNRLIDLLREGFSEPEAGRALEILAGFLAEPGEAVEGSAIGGDPRLASAGAPIRRLLEPPALLEAVESVPSGFLPAAAVRLHRREVLIRIRRYLTAQAGLSTIEAAPRPGLEATLRQAAVCFNAHLFFETHEILEHAWVGMPAGSLRRSVQGLIQVSVGFYHAERGSLSGAVNQLRKGLEKLARPACGSLFPECDAFVAAVRALQDELCAERAQDGPLIPPERIPRLPLWPTA